MDGGKSPECACAVTSQRPRCHTELTAPPRVGRPGLPPAPPYRLKELTGPGAGLPNKLIAFNVGFSKWWQSEPRFPSFMDLGAVFPVERKFPEREAGVMVVVVSGSDVTGAPRHAPFPREPDDWAFCFYVISGASPCSGACVSWAASPRVGCRRVLRFSCLILPSSWPDTMGVTW